MSHGPGRFCEQMEIKLEDIINLVKKAGQEVLKIYQKKFKVYEKEDKSPVTEADFVSEKIILFGLKKYGYEVLSEEREDNSFRLKKEKIWIIDPLDGTRDFLQKTGEFSIMLGLVDKKRPVLGVVYQPIGDKMYFAQKEKGAYLKESGKPLRRLKVSKVFSLSRANFVVSRNHLGHWEKEFMENSKIARVNYVGSIGVKLGLIAQGKADGYLTVSSKTCQWDICAPEIILREAGGEVTDLKGKNFLYNRQEIRNINGIVASNGKIHTLIIKNLNQIL